MKKILMSLLAVVFLLTLTACADEEALNARIEELQNRLTAVESKTTFGPNLESLTLSEGDLTEDLTLPTLAGAQIIWVSSDATVLTSEGRVSRPNLTRGDTDVVLTAIVIDGNLASQKAFNFTVLADGTDDERLLQFVNNLPDEIDEHIELPTAFGDLTVTWTSSHPNVLATDGFVRQPHFEDGNQQVTLSTSMVLDGFVREFSKSVTVLREPVAISGSLGNPFVATLTTDEGHMVHIPIENVDRPTFDFRVGYPLLYTPEYPGGRLPTNINGWGLILEIEADGELIAVYDGIGGVKRLPDGTTTPWKAGDHYAKDPASCEEAGVWTTCLGLEIPEDGFLILFQNSGVPNRNNREFARSYINNGERRFTIEGVTTTPSTMFYEIPGGVWWRGLATVFVPKININANVDTAGLYARAVELVDGVPVAAAPFIFTNSYLRTTGVGQALDANAFDLKNGFAITAEVTPERRTVQLLDIDDDVEIEWELTNEWTITRVYDGIGAGIKNPPPVGTTPVPGADAAKNVRLPQEGYVIHFPNTGLSYPDDVMNRRIGADFFYHLDNWIFEPTLIESATLKAPTRSVPWPGLE